MLALLFPDQGQFIWDAFEKLLMNFLDLIRITSFVLETINNRQLLIVNTGRGFITCSCTTYSPYTSVLQIPCYLRFIIMGATMKPLFFRIENYYTCIHYTAAPPPTPPIAMNSEIYCNDNPSNGILRPD